MAPIKKTQTKAKAASARTPKVTALPLLVEIGTEEIPTTFLPQALQDLAALGKELLDECRLTYREIRTVGTSRRLALLVDGVQTQQASLRHEVVGPPKSAAYDASGAPTKAAQGFAKSQGVSIEQLTFKETPKGVYLAVNKHERGKSAKQVLTSNLSGFLAQLTFPKAMRWNASQAKFARPIRWMVVLLGSQVLKIECAGILSSGSTRGHRFYKYKSKKTGQAVPLTDASTYMATMNKLGVVVDPDERRHAIQSQIDKLAKLGKGQIDPMYREELMEEAVWGVEYPHAILGTFHEDFLALPDRVLISSMKEHQGFLSLIGKDGRLLPKFVAVTNTPWGDTALITKGNERVLTARLKDAQYFLQEDQKHPLHERVMALDGVMFHHKLGTMHQKVERVQELVGWMATTIGRDDLKDVSQRAALLSKADLTTGMVGEFPNLQGVMGEEYARHDGEQPEVCQAIGEHYLPRFPDDVLPASVPGILVACADRVDSIASFFVVGMRPSGSEDPLGLRRAAYGLVRIISETNLQLNVVDAFQQMIQILARQGVGSGKAAVVADIMEFVIDRLRFYGRTTLELRDDVMEAVTRVRATDAAALGDMLSRMQALQTITSQSDFEPLMIGFKRAHRIVEKEAWDDVVVSPERFQHESERQLFSLFHKVQQEVTDAVSRQDYAGALQRLLIFKSPIDEFFAAVMVNDPDPLIRENRLSLLTAIDHLFLTIADFSCLQTTGAEVG